MAQKYLLHQGALLIATAVAVGRYLLLAKTVVGTFLFTPEFNSLLSNCGVH